MTLPCLETTSVFGIYVNRVPIDWDERIVSTDHVPPGQDLISKEVLDNIKANGTSLKGPITTPVGGGHRSLNLTLRKELDLYANVRPCRSFDNIVTPYDKINLVVIRENTEGEYSGIEHMCREDVAQSIKMITRDASLRIARYAFEYAKANGRREVTAVHKANIMKLSDGLFIKCCREVASDYPELVYKELSIDSTSMKLVQTPHQFDVLVMPNLYGDIISDLGAGLIGGLGVTPSGNIGTSISMFEAVHGSAPDIAGQGKANPTALLLSSIMMLKHMGLYNRAGMIERAVHSALSNKAALTPDLGGSGSTSVFTQAIIDNLQD